MKKKISSLLTIIFVLFAGLFATACGNKYKNFEFKVYYAFSADATEWLDGTDGISLNYDKRETLEEGEKPSSLIFTNDVSVLYIKVEVDGVKAKHIDTISISATSLGGLSFSGATVKEGEVVGITITDTVNTTIKIYENNSGRRCETKLVVMKQLAKLELATSDETPAMLIGQNSTLNLPALNNIKYFSLDYVDDQGEEHFKEGETNQTGVTYTIEGIGKYQDGSFIPGTKNVDGIFEIDGSFLKYLVKDEENENGEKFEIDANNHALKIKATSIFHPGTEEEGFTDAISCEFYICLASTMPQPAVLFRDGKNADGTNIKVETLHLYQNGIKDDTKDYSASYINIGPKYDPVYTVDITLYVNVADKGQPENFVKYDFNSGNNDIVSKAGLTITEEGTTEGGDYVMYKIAIANVDLLKENKAKVVYEIDGLDFSCGSKQPGETVFDIRKHVVPKEILINNEVVNENTVIDVFYTTAKYDGIRLDIVATPNEDATRELTLEYNKNISIKDAYKNIIPTTVAGDIATSKIKSGSTIYVKFTADYNSGTDSNTVTISTSAQGEYDGGKGMVGSVSAVCKLNKVVTANSLAFISEKGEEVAENGEFLVDAAKDGTIYLKVNYSNGTLDKKSIKVTSTNPSIKFGNGLNEILLSDTKVESGVPINNGDGLFYSIFTIPVQACNSAQAGAIKAVAGGAAGGIVSCEMRLKSVIVASDDWSDVAIKPVNPEDVLNFTNGFAIRKGESATFEFVNADWVFDLDYSSSDKNDIQDDVFDYGAVSLTRAANAKFIVKGSIANKTAIIRVTPTYYNSELIIPEERKSFEIQVAVYDPIVKVDYAFEGSNTISYVNAFDRDISSTTFTMTGKTSSDGTPTTQLVFKGESENEVIDNFSRVQVDLEKTENVKVYFNGTELTGRTLLPINGIVKVELIAEENSAKNVSIILTPYVYDKIYQYGDPTNVGINIKDAIKSRKLSLSGGGLDDENDAINMSFMDITDGGFDQKILYARLEMEDGTVSTSVDKDVTYLVYKYVQNSDGSFNEDAEGNRVVERVYTNAVTVEFDGSKIVIKAFKEFGGGRYMLVLVPKDAYKGTDTENITKDDFDVSKMVAVDLNVRDGSAIAPYQVADYNDLLSINNNIGQVNVHYELTHNLDLRKYDLTPIGLIGETVNAFQGSFNGAAGTNNQSDSGTIHTIYLNIDKVVTSSNYGNLAGLFAILGENAIVKNLNLVVDFTLSKNYGYVGALAGVNKGQINNVKVTINNANDINLGIADKSNFGGLVGLNENKISSSRVEMSKDTKINTVSNSNIGVVAGVNKGEIIGGYRGVESLDDFTFDVLSSLEVVNCTSNKELYVGGVAGVNNGTIRNMLVGGKLAVGHIDDATNPKDSFLGGIVGVNEPEDADDVALIDTVAALALDVESTATGVDVAGIAGFAKGTINYAKYITAQVVFGFGQTNGQIKGLANVAGLVAKAGGVTVEYSSVESFVLTQINQEKEGEKSNYPTIVSGAAADTDFVTAGLVANGKATISKSFVKGNIEGNNIYLISSSASDDSYFIGFADETKINANGKLATYYIVFNFVTSEVEDDDSYSEQNGSNWWGNEADINKVGGVDYSYLLKDDAPLMILAPQSISANLNADYKVKPGSIYIDEFDITSYGNKIEETILVNYFNNAGEEANTHNIVHTATQEGLVKITKIPANAQTGLRFEIVGDGYRFAYINSSNQIVFTGASGKVPVLVRIYSIFNPDVESYVLFYSHILASEISLGTEEISLYTGMGGKVLSMQAENIFNDKENLTLFNAGDLEQYLKVEYAIKGADDQEIDEADSKLIVSPSSYNNIFIIIKEDVSLGNTQYEDVYLSLYLSSKYYQTAIVENDIVLASVKVRVNLYNVASGVNITGNKEEMPTNGDLSFKAYLNTDYYNVNSAEKTFTSNYLNANANDVEIVDKNKAFIVRDKDEDCDAIKVKFVVTNGEEEALRLLKQAGKEHFIDLFDITFIRSLRVVEGVTVGYIYDIQAELKDQFEYRYITSNIEFEIIVSAESNDSAMDSMVVTLKPTMATTLSFKTYAVQKLQMETDYTSLVTSENEEVLIIEPGKLGNIFLINIQPSYAFIDVASITSSELYVPSLGRNVRMMFTQLVYRDGVNGSTGSWTTTLGTNVQNGNTLELQRISKVNKNGISIYDGRICLYVQVEGFSGLAGNLTATVNVTSKSGDEEQTLVRNKMLTTTYLPGVNVLYDSNKLIENNRYYIQEGTSNNAVDIKIQGYQFNADPIVTLSWVKLEGGEYKDISIDGKLVGDYVTWYFVNDKDSAKFSAIDDSYTISLRMAVSKDMPSAFAVEVNQSLVGKDGAIDSATERVIFHPVNYFLNSLYVSNVNIEINQSDNLNLVFNTDNTTYNPVAEIIDLFESAYGDNYVEELKEAFTYFKDGNTLSFADNNESFVVNYDEDRKTLSIHGLKTFSAVVNFAVHYYYKEVTVEVDGEDVGTGVYQIKFGTENNPSVKTTTFNLDITPVNTEVEILVREASDIFANGQWKLQEGANYVLLNDITLENITPITTAIKSFDGNNRIITIKSFLVNDSLSNYGLFANIEQGTTLKNMMVDYSKFDTLALNNNTTDEVVFGGLVANNNGGIIYNCDVINNSVNDVEISIIVSETTDVVFGGLVGKNTGVITNSRVGRNTYTRVEQNRVPTEVDLGGLTFEIFNKITDDNSNDSTNNKFNILAGGFVGENRGTISTSYVSKTNLINHSNANTAGGTNQTAGFVSRNSGDIQYSYVRANEDTITYANPYATGYSISNKGNGIVAGFVFENRGTISNAYANTELKTDSAYISGFVYTNSGTIRESYAACTMNAGSVDNNAEQPFVGLSEKNELQSFGKLENTYYLIRSANDVPIQQGDKDIAYGLDYTNIQNSEYLVGFSFVLTNTKQEREQGIWSYYSIDGKQRALPELINADNIAHSYRYLKDMGDGTEVLTNVVEFKQGKSTNPYTISTAEEFNKVFQSTGNEFVGSVRFINNIDFTGLSVQTRTNFTLGKSGELTSVDGNGLTIKNIYLEADETTLDRIGLFAGIENAYVKNLNLNFIDSQAGDQFSTTTAVYSGGLAGKINDSVILNITLDGKNTTLTGYNFVGGLAGMVTGDSLIYGVTTNISVRATATGDGLYYKNPDYEALSIAGGTSLSYEEYLKTLSYAGGIAGVIDINTRANTKFNVQYIDVFGSQMAGKQNQGATDANILAEYAGGVAGYAGRTTDAYRLRYFTGENERIVGDTAVGGIYGVLFGDMTACQVTANIDTQFEYDTLMGEYVTKLHNNDQTAELNKEDIGNLNLLQSNKYAGGLVGVAAGALLKATYAKVGISSGSTIGGLVGCSVSSIVNYSYAIPYVDVDNIPTKTIDEEDIKINIGGLMGEAHSISSTKKDVGAYITYLKRYSGSHQGTDVQFTYSTLVVDNVDHEGIITMDYIVAESLNEKNETMIQSNASSKLVYVFAGTVEYTAHITYNAPNGEKIVRNLVQNETSEEMGSKNESAIMELHKLFPDNDEDVEQQVAFQDVFSAWSVIKYWSLKKERYFPLLMNDIVDNLIEIKNENDINKIINNPDADFIVVNNITIEEVKANWVISPTFTGTITGARKSDNRRPVITVKGLKAQTENETMGFFRETRNAKITNLEIVWGGAFASTKGGFDTNGKRITMVSGLVCKDDNTLISNVMVSGSIYETSGTADDNAGYVLSTSEPITGFAGIVGTGSRTNVMGCVFAGKVDAAFTAASSAVHVGGIAGSVQTGDLDSDINFEDAQNAIITNTQVGVAQQQANEEDGGRRYPTTEFTLHFGEGAEAIYIGGIAAKANHVGLSNNIVGGAAYEEEEYQNIDFNISFNKTSGYVHFGGVAGYAERGLISACKAVTKACVTGEILAEGAGSGNNVNFGGLLGIYSQNNDDPGISDSSTRVNFTFANTTEAFKAISDNTNVRLTSGVAELGNYTALNRCLFTGDINTEGSETQTPAIKNLYAGSIAAYNNTTSPVQINEVNTNTVNIVGTPSTKQLYAGGIIGLASAISVKDCANWDRIIPITSHEATGVYVGGAIGKISPYQYLGGTKPEKVDIENTYSVASIITDSIGPKSISIMNLGAFLGGMDENVNAVENISIKNVFYSSDLALTPEENEIDSKAIGTNYEAATLLRNPNWHTEFIALNQDVWKNANSSIPYLTRLEDMMKEYQILTKDYENYKFRKGSVFNPIVIQNSGSIARDVDNYNYYLLSTTESDNKIELTHIENLNGIIIGEDKGVAITHNLVGNVNKHSAISNVHVALENHTSFYSNAVVAEENNGVIFNCSVQGTGIAAPALGGVIAGINSGMISHSYSGVELINAGATSGICANNEMGRLLSNYFTGYIESTTGYGITQHAGTQAEKSYMYNNYMGGVVNTTGRYSKVVGSIANINNLAGANNYVDTFSDIQYSQVGYQATTQDDTIPLRAVPTSQLMKEGLLNGKWYYAATEEAGAVSLDVQAITFAYNYNYPVYNFNKQVHGAVENVQPLDVKHLLYTGTGIFEEDADIGLTSDASYDARFNDLVQNNRVNYLNAFKIPHLGVLSSVLSIVENTPIDDTQTLSDNGAKTITAAKNFVFIYDIDGSYKASDEEKYVEWKYDEHTINGFKLTTFTGIATSHKYYGNNENVTTEATPVTIKNISNHGLFNEVGKAYFGNLILGSFKDLVNSGALAVKTTNPSDVEIGGVSTLEDQNNTSLKEVIVNNITFDEGSVISGKDDPNNAFGTLFGIVYEKLLVKNYKSVSGSTVLVGLDAKTSANAGLIAGVCKDGVIMLEADTDSSFYANIVGGKYAGGIVGKLAGGHIIGEGNTINIYDNTAFNESLGAAQTPKFIGGIAGLSTMGTDSLGSSYIHNINVNIIGQGAEIIINTNAFGGVIGEVQSGTVVIGSADEASELQALSDGEYTPGGVFITAGDKNGGESDKTIIFKSDGENNYYGLTVGLINGGKVDVVNFDIGNKNAGGAASKEKWTIEVVKEDDTIITQSEISTRAIEDASKTYGTAIFVGAMKDNPASDDDSGLKFAEKEFEFDIDLKSESVPNIGGIIGLYESGELDLNITFKDEVFINIEGSTNIGGIIGYATNKIEFVEGAGLGLFASDKEFAKISVLPGKNIGGLIGRWTLTDIYEAGFINLNSISMDYLDLEDDESKVSIQNGEHVENVGGVVGYLSTTGEISGLTNRGNIEYGNFLTEDYIGNMNTEVEEESGNYKFLSAINVGGAVGMIEGGTVSKLANSGNIAGYQNVGGLVGIIKNRADDNTVVLTNCGMDIGENAYIVYEAGKFVIEEQEMDAPPVDPGVAAAEDTSNPEEDEEVLSITSASIGEVSGVLNVGGAVGLAYEGTKISKVATSANVKGNANVGGLVGEAYKAELVMNFVGLVPADLAGNGDVATTEENTEEPTNIKAIYYNQYEIIDNELTLMKGFIPTAIGGFAGKATEGKYENNLQHKVNITSAEEGSKSGAKALNPAISIDKNHMIPVWDQTPVVTYSTGFKEPADIVEFKDIKSGFGGMFGLSNNTTLDQSMAGMIIDMSIKAQLGVNVGTYYGGYLATQIKNFGSLYVHGEVKLDGSYNIGGIIGCADISGGHGGIDGISDTNLQGSGKVHLQSIMSGINVGGLIGKTNTNNISNLTLSGDSRIVIHTENSYNIGGLIGCAEVCSDSGGTGATISGTFTPTSGAVAGDAVNNFGGLIGLLKVGKGAGSVNVKVSGTHYNAFTVNTIENVNYYDGDSRFNMDDSEVEVKLYAEAYYVNQDIITIAPTSDPKWYSETSNNPIDPDNTKGWAKEYTGFKMMQRRISKDNNSDKWDSIGVVYDAAHIVHVGTKANLGIGGDVSGNNGEVLGENDICFTIYEKDKYLPVLYSPIGVASPVYNEDETSDDLYKAPVETRANAWKAILGTALDLSTLTFAQHYVNVNEAIYDKDDQKKDIRLQTLSYFNWQREYKTLGSDYVKYRNWIEGSTAHFIELVYFVPGFKNGTIKYGGKEGAWFKFDVVYENSSSNGMTGVDDDGPDGKPGTKYTISSSDYYLPQSGSIFEACGMYTPTTDIVKQNRGDEDTTKLIVKWVLIVVEIVITIYTMGGFSAAKIGLKSAVYLWRETAKQKLLGRMLKFVGRFFGTTARSFFMQSIPKAFGKQGIKKTLITLAAQGVSIGAYFGAQAASNALLTNSYEAYLNFVKPQPLNYGFVSSSYVRNIHYKKDATTGKITEIQTTDDYIVDQKTGEMYFFLSNDRPADYQNSWIGAEVQESSGVYSYAGDGKFETVALEKYPIKVRGKFSFDEDHEYTFYSNASKTIYAVKKYIYKNGAYYINQNGCSVECEPESLSQFYKKGTYTDVMGGGAQDYQEPHYIIDGGNIYDSCNFDRSTNSYSYGYTATNNTGNLITKNADGSYSINGKTLAKENVEKTKSLTYGWTDIKPSDARDGYTWFDYAYYAVKGDQSATNAPVKYAMFSDKDKAKPSSGTLGVDYIKAGTWTDFQAAGTYNGDISAVTGKWYKNGSEYKQITSDTTLTMGATVYSRSTGDWYRTFIGNITDTKPAGDDRYVQIFPYSFKNPYTSGGASAKIDFSSGGYRYKENGAIQHSPTYYLWQGGYTTVEVKDGTKHISDLVFIETGFEYNYTDANDSDQKYSPLITVQKYHLNSNEEITKEGSPISEYSKDEPLTLAHIVKDWNKGYKFNSGYVIIEGNVVVGILDERYQVYNGKLYEYREDFTLNSNSQVSRVQLVVPSAYASKKWYLSNEKYGFYTRYKYSGNNGKFNFQTTPTGWKNADTKAEYGIVPLGENSLYINYGRTTMFSETCRVIFGRGDGGNELRNGVLLNNGNYASVPVGKITIV